MNKRLTFSAIAVSLLVLAACERDHEGIPTAVPVRTELAKRTSFTPSVTLLGVVRAAQSIPLAAQQRGTIRYPHRFASGLQTGARVTRGEVLADVENLDVNAAQTEARLEMEAAAADFERAQRSYKVGVISQAEHEEKRVRATLAKERFNAASMRLSTLRVIAPASGTLVVTKLYPAGSVVDAAATLAEIATSGAPLVESSVAASERALLRPGLTVKFAARGTPTWSGTGSIAEVAAVVGESGTSRVVATITQSGTLPPPGTGVEVTVEMEPRGSVLSVPEDAIVAGTEGAALFVASTSEGSFARFHVKRVPVVTGGRANGRVEITSGLHDGDRVVVSGVDSLTDDTIAAEVNDKAAQ
ncbi:MAG: rane fusion protein multidrug efflux system [Thermoanaerobaculia bacterium]|nr:rane fusion protein multidrug efflux system [Thermoanaerobaculia bacterium]